MCGVSRAVSQNGRGYHTVLQSLPVGTSRQSYQQWEGHSLQGTIKNNTSLLLVTNTLTNMYVHHTYVPNMYVHTSVVDTVHTTGTHYPRTRKGHLTST